MILVFSNNGKANEETMINSEHNWELGSNRETTLLLS